MDDYNFWADLFDTYQSSADWIKALWIAAGPVFLLGALGLVLRYRLASKRHAAGESGTLAYTVVSDENGGHRIYTHDGDRALAARKAEEAILPLPGVAHIGLAKPPSSDV